ncbi:hypothetical protein NC651_002929 [Populus alba x Populus x berolinensis]|nr:hypothetical protein NC651_002929 [Populus alba x Populus x berolinensis]
MLCVVRGVEKVILKLGWKEFFGVSMSTLYEKNETSNYFKESVWVLIKFLENFKFYST